MDDPLDMTVDEYAASLFLDSIMDAAKRVPKHVFMNETERANDPIIELAYKLYMEGNN